MLLLLNSQKDLKKKKNPQFIISMINASTKEVTQTGL